MELKMMFYLSNVAIAANISQPSVRIGGGLHALIHIYFYTPGSGEHGNPVFNRGSGGGARGCGFEERVGVHARTGWVQFT